MERLMNLNTIENTDCTEGLKRLPDESVDCCVTSPPYFGLRDYGTAKWEGGDPGCDHKKVSTASVEKSRSTSTIAYSENTGHSLDNVYKDECGKCGARRIDDQIGLEETPEHYVAKLVEVFSEVRRVLKPEGTLWLNLGDSYAGSWGNYGGQNRGSGSQREIITGSKAHQKSYDGLEKFKPPTANKVEGIKPKDLIGIPWMVAFALRSAGYYLRQDIIWAKPNPMPESVTDRCTKSHEYIFLLSKSSKYYYDQDAIRTTVKDSTVQRMMQQIEDQKGSNRVPGKTNGNMKAVGPGRTPRNGVDYKGGNQGSTNGIKAYSHRGTGDKKLTGHSGNFDSDGNLIGDGLANKKSVWTVTTKPFSEAHFATFPEELIVDMIKAGCPEFVCKKCGKPRERLTEKEYVKHENWFGDYQQVRNSRGEAGNSYNELVGTKTIGFTDCGCNAGFTDGIVLDPFMGAGTTALVASKLNRNFIGFELNPEYIKIAKKRLQDQLGMFNKSSIEI